jgi:hypothetical protein
VFGSLVWHQIETIIFRMEVCICPPVVEVTLVVGGGVGGQQSVGLVCCFGQQQSVDLYCCGARICCCAEHAGCVRLDLLCLLSSRPCVLSHCSRLKQGQLDLLLLSALTFLERDRYAEQLVLLS